VRLGDYRGVPQCVNFLNQDISFYFSSNSSYTEKTTYDKNINSTLRKGGSINVMVSKRKKEGESTAPA
jgi:hypothetical protein